MLLHGDRLRSPSRRRRAARRGRAARTAPSTCSTSPSCRPPRRLAAYRPLDASAPPAPDYERPEAWIALPGKPEHRPLEPPTGSPTRRTTCADHRQPAAQWPSRRRSRCPPTSSSCTARLLRRRVERAVHDGASAERTAWFASGRCRPSTASAVPCPTTARPPSAPSSRPRGRTRGALDLAYLDVRAASSLSSSRRTARARATRAGCSRRSSSRASRSWARGSCAPTWGRAAARALRPPAACAAVRRPHLVSAASRLDARRRRLARRTRCSTTPRPGAWYGGSGARPGATGASSAPTRTRGRTRGRRCCPTRRRRWRCARAGRRRGGRRRGAPRRRRPRRRPRG